MPRYSINFLCRSDKVCEEVCATMMGNYEIKKSNGNNGFDHYAVKEFDSMTDAANEAWELKKASGGRIIYAAASYADGPKLLDGFRCFLKRHRLRF